MQRLIAALFIIIPNWKQPKCPSMGGMDKQTVLYPYNGLPLSNKKEYTVDTCNNINLKEFLSKRTQAQIYP